MSGRVNKSLGTNVLYLLLTRKVLQGGGRGGGHAIIHPCPWRRGGGGGAAEGDGGGRGVTFLQQVCNTIHNEDYIK